MIQKIDNPFWDIVKTLPGNPIEEAFDDRWVPDGFRGERSRDELCLEYAWAIPDPAALAFAARHLMPKAVEIGAGTGYWASLLAQLGVEMICYDLCPPHIKTDNHWHSPRVSRYGGFSGKTRNTYHDVREGDHIMAAKHPDCTLFLCWPPYSESMAAETLKAYTGNKLVYIGEPGDGCTGDDEFRELLEEAWHEVESHRLVQWWGIHDEIFVYERNS